MARVVPEVVQLFALEFVLDSLAIGCIPNQRKNGSDSLDQHGPLRDICVVKRRLGSTISVETIWPQIFVPSYLNTIIPVGISQQLLESRPV
jgi:hypothetical protein